MYTFIIPAPIPTFPDPVLGWWVASGFALICALVSLGIDTTLDRWDRPKLYDFLLYTGRLFIILMAVAMTIGWGNFFSLIVQQLVKG